METDTNVIVEGVPQRSIPADTFRARLKLARLHAGDLTIRQAAERCGLIHASWANWEKGMEPRGKAEIVEAISEGLGIDRDWLMYGGPLAREVKRRHLRAVPSASRRETNRGSTRAPGRPHSAVKRLSCPPPSVRSEGDATRTRRPRRIYAHATDSAA